MRMLLVLLMALASTPDLRFLQGEYANRKFDELYAAGNLVWMGIATVGGTDLYLYDEGTVNTQRVRPSCRIDSVEALDGDGTRIYLGDRSGSLFRLTPENQCEKIVQVGSRIRALAWDSSRAGLWVAADQGLYLWSASGLQDQKVTAFKPKALRVAAGTLWLGTEQGLWKHVDGMFQKQELSTELDSAEINAVEVAAGQVWFGNHLQGLHRWPLEAGQRPVSVEFGAKQVASLFRHGSALLIGSESGLLRVNVADAPWDAKIRVEQLEPRTPRPGERLQLKWDITNYDERTSRELVGQRVEVLNSANAIVDKQEVKPAAFDLVLQVPQESGDYRLRFVASDLAGRAASSEPAGATFAVQASASSFPGGWLLAGALLVAAGGGVLAVRNLRGRADRASEPAGKDDQRAPVPAGRQTPNVTTRPGPASDSRSGPHPSPGAVSPLNLARPLKVFVCHSATDKPQVRRIYSWLQDVGADPWLDEEKLLPGQDWEREITVAVQESDAVLVCLSQGSVSKRGYVQKELRFALDIAEQQPEGAIFLIPVKLEECQPPARLHYLHWVNVFEEKGYERLLAALQTRADALHIQLGGERRADAGRPST